MRKLRLSSRFQLLEGLLQTSKSMPHIHARSTMGSSWRIMTCGHHLAPTRYPADQWAPLLPLPVRTRENSAGKLRPPDPKDNEVEFYPQRTTAHSLYGSGLAMLTK